MRQARRGHSAVLVALLAGAAGALASCGLIVGVGDYKVGDAAADANPDEGIDVGGGGDVGADRTETGGGDGKMGDTAMEAMGDAASERGDADGAVEEEVRDAGATDADADAPQVEAGLSCGQGIPTSAAFSNLVTACVAATSCDPYLLPLTLSNCVGNSALSAAGDSGPMSCLYKIANCNDYYNCQGIRIATQAECPQFASSCQSANVAVDCSAGEDGGVPGLFGTVTNCSAALGGCRTFTDSFGNSRAGCLIVPSCIVPAAGGWQCSGNNAYQCISADGGTMGVGYGYSCGKATCSPTVNGAPCTFNGTGVCASPTTARCSGDTLQVACVSPGTLNYDCTQAGGSCASDNAGNTGCVSPGCTLSSPCAESCDGFSLITTCVGGAPYTIDCTSYGSPSFTSCFQNEAGTPSWCVP